MSTEVSKPLSFEEKITARLRDAMADLITDDDLKAYVERGVEKALFQSREVPSSGWGSPTVKASLVDEAVNRFLSERMREAVDAWIKANPERLQEAVDKAIALGVGGCLLTSLDQRLSGMFYGLTQNLQNAGLLPR